MGVGPAQKCTGMPLPAITSAKFSDVVCTLTEVSERLFDLVDEALARKRWTDTIGTPEKKRGADLIFQNFFVALYLHPPPEGRNSFVLF